FDSPFCFGTEPWSVVAGRGFARASKTGWPLSGSPSSEKRARTEVMRRKASPEVRLACARQ
ncbi:hypothetical protein, partial [Mesotoga sp. H07pep.5.4]|uniref:hypothetical protein n=1 Tax=Mesotoga sp. H07pep.5.4 TaxID=1463664 RepID=UPI001C7CDE41